MGIMAPVGKLRHNTEMTGIRPLGREWQHPGQARQPPDPPDGLWQVTASPFQLSNMNLSPDPHQQH